MRSINLNNLKIRAALIIPQLVLCVSFLSLNATAGVGDDFDSLGGNEKIISRAKSLNSNRTVRVVQNRIVNRSLRLEAGGFYGGIAGGDSYINTSTYGAMAEFHITPQWSIGGRFNKYNNALTSEGNRAFEDADKAKQSGQKYTIPTIDYAKQSMLATLTWYPLYGKLNLFDMGVTQFDVYVLGGYGSMTLASGNTALASAGGGIAFWLAQHVSARFEARWQGYTDQQNDQSRRVNTGLATVMLGFLL